ncbi:hypothetical protein HIM_07653 [Hirsutella minnesotensis 3608]|uniref:Dihydrofolate reductase n=1 Tax=Hirsutella minnesotensis 3608 TaxID=1043627 RepID=A0A0F7ZN01_9HYPO|nr:hypothetical protein HIM_07653 [Hirsutella minnesotensis 3608]
MQAPDLTLIVAATRNMGIGAHGTMPWTGLRKEMQYFSRVTTRLPPQAPAGAVNAVIMGRKTWDTIPNKFRPLKDRLNIVISRSAPPPPAATQTQSSPPSSASPSSSRIPIDEPLRVPSLEHALSYARARHADGAIARVFVMGGAQIYAAALAAECKSARRILLTRIERDFDCDTFFPLDPASGERADAWVRRTPQDLREWTGETLDDLHNEEAGTPYEFEMWERQDS